jgi:hypothetical protein
MRTTNWLVGILMAGALVLGGGGKSEKPAPSAAVILAKLQQAFPAATPEIQKSLGKIAFGFRYGQYPAALAELDNLAANPSLTEAQKQAVSGFTEEMKKMAARAAAKPTQ